MALQYLDMFPYEFGRYRVAVEEGLDLASIKNVPWKKCINSESEVNSSISSPYSGLPLQSFKRIIGETLEILKSQIEDGIQE